VWRNGIASDHDAHHIKKPADDAFLCAFKLLFFDMFTIPVERNKTSDRAT